MFFPIRSVTYSHLLVLVLPSGYVASTPYTDDVIVVLTRLLKRRILRRCYNVYAEARLYQQSQPSGPGFLQMVRDLVT